MIAEKTPKVFSNIVGMAATILILQPLFVSAVEYKNLPAIFDDIHACTNGCAGDVSCLILQDNLGSNIWTEGSPVSTNILLLKISKGGSGSGRRNILVLGNQHAGEWIGYLCALDMAQFVISNRTSTTWPAEARFTNHFARFKDMNVEKLTDNADILVVPMMNPSGYAYTRTLPFYPDAYYHRKNWRMLSNDATSPQPAGHDDLFWEIQGVDLNRNWPGTDWGQVGVQANFPGPDQTTRTCRLKDRRLYCGRPEGNDWNNYPCGPIQEKEIQAITTLADSNDFHCIIDLHSCAPLVGWNGNADTATVQIRPNQGWSGDYQVMQLLAAKTAGIIGGSYIPKVGAYPVSGDSLAYHYEKSGKQALTFLIEIADEYRPADTTAHANAVLPGQLFMMFAAVDRSFAAKPTARFRKPQ